MTSRLTRSSCASAGAGSKAVAAASAAAAKMAAFMTGLLCLASHKKGRMAGFVPAAAARRRSARRAALALDLARFLFLGLGVDPAQPFLPRFLDQPVPVDRIAAGALGAGLADQLVIAAGRAAGADRRAAADPGAADILQFDRPVGPALVDRRIGVVAQHFGNPIALAFGFLNADVDRVVGARRAGVVAIEDQL